MTREVTDMLKRLMIALAFSVAFAYIESAVVVYLRAIFYPDGFTFPLAMFDLTNLGRRLGLTEIGREAATLVLIVTAAWLFGGNRQERVAYFLLIFAVWDIFYYAWLRVLLEWPASMMDWDVLFLIPRLWASAVLYPVLVSIAMVALAVVILYRSAQKRPLIVRWSDWAGWAVATTILIGAFCLGGRFITETDYRAAFPEWLFALGFALGLAVSVRVLTRT
jgi:multidrug transporter EmrE-like cation transporter